jgi:sortase (surface protein transpeptidase)
VTRPGVAGICLLVAGCLVVAGLTVTQPRTRQQAPAPATAPSAPAAASEGASTVGPPESAGAPLRISIPAIGVDAAVVGVGLRADGAMEVPAVDRAGWYRLGPRPGEPGPAVIVGHVDSRGGPAVFHRLRQLQRGDGILVGRTGGTTAAFTVEAVEQQPKSALPVGRIWNRTAEPVLRLITCGGTFDRTSRHYRDNVIVYAKLSRP